MCVWVCMCVCLHRQGKHATALLCSGKMTARSERWIFAPLQDLSRRVFGWCLFGFSLVLFGKQAFLKIHNHCTSAAWSQCCLIATTQGPNGPRPVCISLRWRSWTENRLGFFARSSLHLDQEVSLLYCLHLKITGHSGWGIVCLGLPLLLLLLDSRGLEQMRGQLPDTKRKSKWGAQAELQRRKLTHAEWHCAHVAMATAYYLLHAKWLLKFPVKHLCVLLISKMWTLCFSRSGFGATSFEWQISCQITLTWRRRCPPKLLLLTNSAGLT